MILASLKLLMLLGVVKLSATQGQDRILIIHGGAGDISADHAAAKKVVMLDAMRAGYAMLQSSDNPLAAVEAAVRIMEDSPAFNAGRGSVLTEKGEVEMDAIIINGTDLSTGAVAGVRHIKNPISLARLVKDTSEHVLLVGQGAELFALNSGVTLIPTKELIADFEEAPRETPKEQVPKRRKRSSEFDVGTVGAVAINSQGQISAATSTGGMSGKMEGRVGDTPIVGGGTLADDEIGGISATGWGEAFIKFRVASRVANLIEQGANCTAAIDQVLAGMANRIPGADGGIIAISKTGDFGFGWNSNQMAWAYSKGVDIHYGVDRGEDITAPLGGGEVPSLPNYSSELLPQPLLLLILSKLFMLNNFI